MNPRRHRIAILVFLTPAIVFYTLFLVYPYLKAFYISLLNWRGASAHMTFVGLANFHELFHDPYFWNALKNTVFFTIADGTLVPIIALFVAVVLSRRLIGGARFFRVIFFFPNLISVVAISVLWSFVFNPDFGILSNFLKLMGVKTIFSWLGDPKLAPWCIVTVKVWAAVGFYIVLYLATIEGIPTDLYDAGKIDGTSEWQAFWHITFPLLSEMMKVTVVFLLLNGFGTFAVVQIMTDGGPNRRTDTLATYLYENAFEFSKFGYATAIAVTLFVITFVLSIISMRLQKKETVQY